MQTDFSHNTQIILESLLWDNLRSCNDIKKYIELKKINNKELIGFKKQMKELLLCVEKFMIE